MEDVATPLFAASMIPLDQAVLDHSRIVLSRQITELQHKFNQAMENVVRNISSVAWRKYQQTQSGVSDSTDDVKVISSGQPPPSANNSGSSIDDAVTLWVSDSSRTTDTAAETDALPEHQMRYLPRKKIRNISWTVLRKR